MTNQTCSNRPHHAPQYVVAIVALVLAFAALPRGVFGQAATSASGLRLGSSDPATWAARWERCG